MSKEATISAKTNRDIEFWKSDFVVHIISRRHEHPLSRGKYSNGNRRFELSLDDARKLFHDVQRFLYVKVTSGDTAKTQRWRAPPAIEEALLIFITCTEAYRRFCMEVFGKFIDHQPDVGYDVSITHDRAQGMQLARQAALEYFGDLSPNWDIPPVDECGERP